MMRIVMAALLILALAAPAAAGVPPAQSGTSLWNLLAQLQQLFSQLRAWISGQLDDAVDGARERLSPILDTAHAAQTLARWVESVSKWLPSDLQYLVQRAADRLRQAPAPKPGTGPAVVQEVIKTAPTGPVADRARALDTMTAENSVSVGKARAAQIANEMVAQAVLADQTPALNVSTAQQAARELALRAQQTPSTRAAIQLLVEAFAAQMDLVARYHADVVGRLGAAVQQQVALGQQLVTSTERLAAAVELLNEQQKQQLIEDTAAAVATLQQSNGAMEALLIAAKGMRERSGEAGLYSSLRELVQQRR